jgi:hypothetical protein
MSSDRARIEEVERSMEATRGRMAATVAELDEAVSSRVEGAKEAIDVRRLVADHPWPALFLALGAGILLARSGADAQAAQTVKSAPALAKRGAKRVASAVGDATNRRRAKAEEDWSTDEQATRNREALTERVTKALHGDELLADMRAEADRIGQ